MPKYVDQNGVYLGTFEGTVVTRRRVEQRPRIYRHDTGLVDESGKAIIGEKTVYDAVEVLFEDSVAPEIPEGAVEVPTAPLHVSQRWDGQRWSDPPLLPTGDVPR